MDPAIVAAAAAEETAAAAAARLGNAAAAGGGRNAVDGAIPRGVANPIGLEGPILRNETRRTISPYDLTSADNPGAVISHPMLKGFNYDEWACGMKTALVSRKKFGFLDGTIGQPDSDSPDLEDWWTINALLVSWIKMTIDPALRSNISHRDIAQDLWEHLKKRFAVMNGPRLQQIKADLANCRQKGASVDVYYGKLNKIWDSLASSRPLRNCTCGLREQLEAEREEDRVHQFLFGLDDQFRTVRSSLVSRVPLPPLEEVYNIVRQEEDMRFVAEEKPEVTAFLTTNNKMRDLRFRNEEKGRLCKHCNRSGHDSDSCYSVIGFPEWWGERPKGRTIQGKNRSVNQASGSGRGRGFQANRVNVADGRVQVNHVVTDGDRDGVSGMSEAQWQAIKRILNAEKDVGTEKLTGSNSFSSWILDTGASHHLTGKFDLLENVHDMSPVSIVLADGREKIAVKEGSIRLGSQLVMKSVYYVEGLHSDLISVGQLLDENLCVIQLSDKFLVIQDRTTRTVIGVGKRSGGTFYFRSMEVAAAVSTRERRSFDLWHHRLGHASAKVVGLLPSVCVSVSDLNKVCEVCLRAKQSRDVFPVSLNKTNSIFELIHVDLWGPYRTPSHSGSRFFLTIVDDYSRGVWIYLLQDKSETVDQLKKFFSLTVRQFAAPVRKIRSDNGSEFLSMTEYFDQQGIVHETSCVGTPQQNGRVERKHRHILNVARALRFQSNLPIEFWGECVLTAGYLINRTPSVILGNSTPYERLYQKPPPYDHLRVFGSLCYAHNQKRGGDKFESRSRRCVFVGYPHGKRGWRLYDLEKQEFFVSRDVVFSEDVFPFATNADVNVFQEMTEVLPAQTPTLGVVDDEFLTFSSGDSPVVESQVEMELAQPAVLSEPENVSEPPDLHEADPTEAVEMGRGHRKKTSSVILKDYITNSAIIEPTSSSAVIRYPLAAVDDVCRFSQRHCAYVAAVMDAEIPKTYQVAVRDKNWRLAMQKEVHALEENQTWSVGYLPPEKRVIGSKWVYTIKYNSDGSIERYKARLVALGNKQVEGEDFGETFAPVAKMGTVRLFLDVAVKQGWVVHQMDVHNAFLHGDLDDEVYMRMPPGFQSSDRNQVCRLRKSLYGLRQAPRCWFAKLSSALIEYGFTQSLSDYSLFTLERNDIRLHILIYVDDLIITGNSVSATEDFKLYLSSCFHMKDLGPLKYFLGIEVARNESGFYLCQRKYALDIISETGLLGSKPAAFPLEQNHQLAKSESDLLQDPTQYRRILGRLIYLGVTRPDLSYSVHTLAQFMQAPREDHWKAALRVVRYLKSDPGQGILLRSDPNFHITGWCDSDWASCPLTRRSLTGYFVQLGDSPISWKTRKQPTVSRSSAEAEYRALAVLTQELIWLKRMLVTLGISHEQPMTIRCDSKSAIHIATNPVFHERTKHIELDCHFVRDEVVTGNIEMQHVDSASQLADIFTKAIGRDGFVVFRDKLGIQNLYAPA